MQTSPLADGTASPLSATLHQPSPSELAFLLDVLEITDGSTEDQFDATLRSRASDLGLPSSEFESELKAKSQSVSTCASSERPRRSDSVNSRISQSTGLTSIDSEPFRDRANSHQSRPSQSFRDDETAPVRGATSWPFPPMTSISGSTFSFVPPQTSPSDAMPRKHFRKFRELRKLKFHRADSVVDFHHACTTNASDRRKELHQLPYSHQERARSVQSTVRSTVNEQNGAASSWSRGILPGSTGKTTMTRDEEAFLEDPCLWDQVSPLTSPSPLHPRSLPPTLPPLPSFPPLIPHRPSLPCRNLSDDSRTDSLIPTSSPTVLNPYLEHPDYQRLLRNQTSQRDRFLSWQHHHRHALLTTHLHLRQSQHSSHTTALQTLTTTHLSALSTAEDHHVLAEADLRASQAHERRDLTTALAHMEAFCAGHFLSDATPHFRPITAQDRAELAKTQHRRDALALKHSNAVNVLRGEQARRLRARIGRQEIEVTDLVEVQRREERELERKCEREQREWEEDVSAKRERMEGRWWLETRILKEMIRREEGGTEERGGEEEEEEEKENGGFGEVACG